jgi:hypothetical protein
MADIDYLKKLQEAMAGNDPDVMLSESEASAEQPIVNQPVEDVPVNREPAESVDMEELEAELGTVSEAPKELDAKAKYRELIKQYEESLNKKREASSDDKVMNWMTAAGQVADVMNRDANRPTSGVQYWGDKQSKRQEAEDKEKRAGLQQLQKMYQNYMNLDKKKDGMTDYQKKNLDIQKRRLDLIEGKEGRLTKKDAFKEEVGNRLSDKEVLAVNAFDDGVRILDDIDNLLKNTNVKDDLGPYASRMEEMQRYVPGMERDEAFVKTQQLVGIQLADYVKSISGAQVSEQEAQRLLKNIPNMTDKPASFKAKLDQFRDDLADAKKTYLTNIGKQKSAAKKFMGKLDDSKSDAPHGDIVERNGKKYKWNPIVKKYQLI